jgi:hypothetical protein
MNRSNFILFIFLFTLLLAVPSYGQKKSRKENHGENSSPFGRKKKEKRNQSGKVFSKRGGGMFKKKHSAGNADAFASNSIRKRGFFSKLFSGNGGSKNASLRKSKPGKLQEKEQSKLFKRHRTSSKHKQRDTQKKQNHKRGKTRTRGNNVFHQKKR